tara:strand:+ start:2686 stop:2850 length:165 start_codon:yes stop_codon:yes gene_type:complete
MRLLLDLEGVFFASGKAPVVLGVALIILFGLAYWMCIMDKKISNLEDQNHKKEE